jgi:predicted flap endonuclease-1-like 5' DNA nuclease
MNRSIENIEGIGPKYAKILKAAGVMNTGQLLAEGGDRKRRV